MVRVSSRWGSWSCPTGPASLVPGTTNICLFDGFRPDKLYELIYPAKNPTVMGLAYAVTRSQLAKKMGLGQARTGKR